MNRSITKRFASALALAVSFGLLALSPVSAGTTHMVRSYEMHCSEFQRIPRQVAHAANMKFVEAHWTRYLLGNTCMVIYDGPQIPYVPVLKDEVIRQVGGTEGRQPSAVAQYGDVFHASSNFTICTVNSKKGPFVAGHPPKVKWSDLEDYIRSAGVNQGIGYGEGQFSSENHSTLARPDKHYGGPSRKWIVPDGVFVVKPHGKRILAGYEVHGEDLIIKSDWYFFC